MHRTYHRATAGLFCMMSGVTPAALAQGPIPAPAPGTMFVTPERIPLADGSSVDAERGWLFVPLVRSDTSRGMVSVEVWRFRAQRPTDRPPIFRLPGGPGFEGLEEDLDDDYIANVVRSYTAIADYVVVGQRGIGTSKPNTLCPIGIDGGPGEFSRQCRAYWEGRGLDVRGFNVIEAAADVADAARALGYDRIVLRGGSFGSHWSMAVMRYHPELVAWAIVSGTEGPDHTYDSPSGIFRALSRIASDAERDPRVAARVPEGGLMGALDSVYARLAQQAVRVSVTDSTSGEEHTVTFTAEDVRGWSTGYTRGLGSRRDAAVWPEDILRLYDGDFEHMARRDLRLMRRATASTAPSYTTGAEFLLDCASGVSPGRLAALRDDPANALVQTDWSWYEEICDPWDVDVGDDFRLGFETDVPTVIVHGTWDVNTPLDNALELLPRFHVGKLVTVHGGSHGALGEAMAADSTFADAFWRYLRTGDVDVMPDSVVLPPVDWALSSEARATGRHSRF